MNEQDYTLLSQYLDGELAADASKQLRQRLLAEPDLRAVHDRMAKVDAALREAFDFPGVDEVPQHVSILLAPAVDNGAGDSAGGKMRRAGWGLAIAASVLVASGIYLDSGTGGAVQSELAVAPGSLVNDAAIAGALDDSPSRATGWIDLGEGQQLRPVLTFASNDGTWCREYLLSTNAGDWRGVACLEGSGQWTTHAIGPAATIADGAEYRPASGASARDVAAYIDAHAADVPLGIAEEAALIARDWR